MSNSKPQPQVRKPPSDVDHVTAFIRGDDETPERPDVQTSGDSDGETSERKQTTVYLDADVKRKLKAYCNLEDREMSQFVNELVAGELEDWTPDF
jgi:hypothetical protein